MDSAWQFIVIVAVYFIAMRWILPRFGVPT
jgi:hypothetical protein